MVSELPFKDSYEVILPYAYGALRTYLYEFYPELEQQVRWQAVFRWNKLDTIQFETVDLLMLSCYVWNIQTQMHLAKIYKSVRPDGIVICGGPQVPLNGGAYAEAHPEVDFWVYKEGEEPFRKILQSLLTEERSVSLEKRIYLQAPEPPRNFPKASPYSLKFYDPYLPELKGTLLTALWETTRGCPFHCSFCNWGSYTSSKVRPLDEERLYKDLEWFGKNQVNRVYITDANFGILGRDVQIAERLAETKRYYGWPRDVRTNYNKNTTERVIKINDIFLENEMSFSGATISVQSLDETTLKNIRRENIGFERYLSIADDSKKRNITSYTEVIMGLPGETLQTFRAGVNKLVERGLKNIRFYPALVLENTDFNEKKYQEQHGIGKIAKKLYVNAPVVFGTPIIERAEVVSKTAHISEAEMIEMYKFSYIIQAFYCTGFLKLIYDSLLVDKVEFSEFISGFMAKKDECLVNLNKFIDELLWAQFQTDSTNMFGLQYRTFYYKEQAHTIHGAPWNLIWLHLMLNKESFFQALEEYILSHYQVPAEPLRNLIHYQKFVLLDIELWEEGAKEFVAAENFLQQPNFTPNATRYLYKVRENYQKRHLTDYLYFSTGATVVTEFKYLMNPEQIEVIGA